MVFNMDSLARDAADGRSFHQKVQCNLNEHLTTGLFSSHLGWAEGTLMSWKLLPLLLYWSHLLSMKHSTDTHTRSCYMLQALLHTQYMLELKIMTVKGGTLLKTFCNHCLYKGSKVQVVFIPANPARPTALANL